VILNHVSWFQYAVASTAILQSVLQVSHNINVQKDGMVLLATAQAGCGSEQAQPEHALIWTPSTAAVCRGGVFDLVLLQLLTVTCSLSSSASRLFAARMRLTPASSLSSSSSSCERFSSSSFCGFTSKSNE
jgi:hypothetical protein